MIIRKSQAFFFAFLTFFAFVALNGASADNQTTADSEQQINDFSLSGFGERGKKTWDITGKTADVYTDTVKLKDITGNLYGEKENVKLTAESGDFDKAESKVYLKHDVVVTTSSGAKLTTDSLDWDRKQGLVTTADKVNIEKDNIISTSKGATGQPGLNKVSLEKEVKVEILPGAGKNNKGASLSEKITVTCDGPLSLDYEKNIATFNNNVKVEKSDWQIYSDTMDIYFNSDKAAGKNAGENPVLNSKIDKIIAKGNVKIVRGENISYSAEATYASSDKKITLSGSPRLVIYSTENINASFGN